MSAARRSWATWVVLIGALVLLLLVGATYGRRAQQQAMRNLLFAETEWPMDGLQACLSKGLPLKGDWKALPGGHWQGRDASGQLLLDLADHGARRRLEISSLGGVPLNPRQSEALRRCLAAG